MNTHDAEEAVMVMLRELRAIRVEAAWQSLLMLLLVLLMGVHFLIAH